MTREDLELPTGLSRINNAMTSLALRIMEGSATVDEQRDYAQRLIAAGQKLRCRAEMMDCLVIDDESAENTAAVFPRKVSG
jgi:hypothetical protein